jgi:hypothetical protein
MAKERGIMGRRAGRRVGRAGRSVGAMFNAYPSFVANIKTGVLDRLLD